jgi:hypothetical protein
MEIAGCEIRTVRRMVLTGLVGRIGLRDFHLFDL